MTSELYDAVIVGAGFGGIGAAIQLKRMGFENFVILDREDDLGGTWHVNRYPGLAVDVPTTTYSYFFEPNPNWSRLFTPGPEIKQYADDVADKFDVRRHMRFNTTVEGARWDAEADVWRITVADGEMLSARYLITATGFLSQPKVPDIPGVTDFAGKTIHTTAWDDKYPLEGRRVAVIGTGATAVQLIPELAKRVADLTVYQRTPIWVVPKIDLRFGERAKRLFARIPLTQRAIRWLTDSIYEVMINTAIIHHRHFRRLNIAAADLSKIHRFASIRDKELRRRLTPDYDFGCKRPTFSNGYYRAFTKPHVHLQTDGIARIEADGIVNVDGSKTEIDTLVLATGFDLWDANFPAIEIIGREGRNLGKWWRETRFQAYQGVSVPQFPNFITLNSPYSYSGLSYFMTIEVQMRHLERLFGSLQSRDARTFEVSQRANDEFLARMLERMDDTVFNLGSCATSRSYYYTNEGDAVILRPTSSRSARRAVDRFPISDYEFA